MVNMKRHLEPKNKRNSTFPRLDVMIEVSNPSISIPSDSSHNPDKSLPHQVYRNVLYFHDRSKANEQHNMQHRKLSLLHQIRLCSTIFY
jgi:hypothetical protein